ncbi:MAG: ribonuclease III [Bacteroidia bacterium]|nr:ribonuclease III [Bacteroidia bacterium]
MLTPRQTYNLYFSRDKEFVRDVYEISGFVPKEVFLYRLALTHSSSINGLATEADRKKAAARGCNERLEFLGDSILDSIIAEFLFKIYPTKGEGFLTEMRSKIVNRKSLNKICRKLRVDTLIRHRQNGSINESMYGDALEALIGAIYMDLGYHFTKRFVYKRILEPHVHLHSVERQIISYKNKLIEYVQKTKMGQLVFEVIEEIGDGRAKIFRIAARVGDQTMGIGEGKNKKTAEQRASQDALTKLNLISS